MKAKIISIVVFNLLLYFTFIIHNKSVEFNLNKKTFELNKINREITLLEKTLSANSGKDYSPNLSIEYCNLKDLRKGYGFEIGYLKNIRALYAGLVIFLSVLMTWIIYKRKSSVNGVRCGAAIKRFFHFF
jgi:hypothetical protein